MPPSRRMRSRALPGLALALLALLAPIMLGGGSSPAPSAPAHPIERPASRGSLFSSQPGGTRDSQTAYWISGAGLVSLLAVLGAASWAARRWRLIAPRAGGPISVISRTQLTPKHTVHLIQAGGRTLLIGTGAGGSPTLLGQWEPGQAPGFDLLDKPASSPHGGA